MNSKLPNLYIVQAITGVCLLIAGAVSSMMIGACVIYAVCGLIEIYLLYILVKAIKRRDKHYIYTMIGTIICMVVLAILIADIVDKLETIA